MLVGRLMTLGFALTFVSSGETASALANRIDKLADSEPVASAIDTHLRVAAALMPVDARTSGKFLSRAIALLKSHPEVPRTDGMADGLLFLNPPEAEKLLLAGAD